MRKTIRIRKLAVAAGVVLGVCIILWFSCSAYWERKFEASVHTAKKCTKLPEILSIFGPPYRVSSVSAPQLGGHLVEQNDVEGDVWIYAFILRKMPPEFLVVKVRQSDGRVLSIGRDKS